MAATPTVIFKPSRAKRTSTILTQAKEVLETTRWCKGFMIKGNKHISVCALGALHAVTCGWKRHGRGDIRNIRNPYGNRHIAAENLLDSFSPTRNVVGFNDGSARSKADVLAVFDKAIAAAKRDERRARYERNEQRSQRQSVAA